jgi:hypothetical protein
VEGKTDRSIRQAALDGFEPHLAFLLRSWFADPYDAAPNGIQLIVVGDDLDDLSALQPETSPEPEPLGRTVHDQAGNPSWVGSEVDHHAGSLFRDNTLRAATFVRREGVHGFTFDAECSLINLY